MFDKLAQIKEFIKASQSEIMLLIGVILISLISFAAGRLSAPSPQKQHIAVESFAFAQPSATSSYQAFVAENSVFKNIISDNSTQAPEQSLNKTTCVSGKTCFVASKNSTKYHLPNCPGARRIAEHNKIWFSSKEEAESLGYQPASNCPALHKE